MIITLKGANFSASNIGTLTTWNITKSLGAGATSSNNATSVARGGSYSTTITLAADYEIGSAGVSVTMGGLDITSTASSISGNTISISIGSVTGNVSIKVPTKNLTTGGESGGTDTPDVPVNPPAGGSTTLSPYSVSTGFYLDSKSKFAPEPSSSIMVYSVQPNSTYTLSVEKKSTGTSSNANLIFAPAKSLNGLKANGTPDFAAGYSARIVELSTNETNVLNYQFTTPANCIYLLFSNHKSGSKHTVVGVPSSGSGNTQRPEEPEGTDIALTKAVDGVYLGPGAKYTDDPISQVLCYAVSPNKTYVIGAPLNLEKKLVVCCVKGIDNIAAGNTATFATDWSDRQIGDAGANLTVTTPADCTHLVFSNYLQNQAPSYVKLVN